jgi:hypothetical protein
MEVVAALAAVGLGELQPEEAELGAAPVQLPREFARRLPLIDMRRDLRRDEPLHGPPQLLMLRAERRQGRPRAAVLDDGSGHRGKCKFSVTNREIWVGREYGRCMERTRWTDERVDDLVVGIDRRFDQVDRRFDRVEGVIKDIRSLMWWLWATTILANFGLFVTLLLRT